MNEEYKKTRKTLEAYRKQLRRVEAQRQIVAALEQSGPTGRPCAGGSCGISDPTHRAVLILERERGRLERLETELVWHEAILRLYLDGVEDDYVRLILFLKYVEGKTWRQIAVRHGMGSEDAVRMLSARYLETHPMTCFQA